MNRATSAARRQAAELNNNEYCPELIRLASAKPATKNVQQHQMVPRLASGNSDFFSSSNVPSLRISGWSVATRLVESDGLKHFQPCMVVGDVY